MGQAKGSLVANERPRLLIILATLNERSNLPTLVERLRELLVEAHLLVVDDNSADGTAVWCQHYGARDRRFHLLVRNEERGLGLAARAGMQFGIGRGFDLIATMDADWSHDPDDLLRLLRAASNVTTPEVGVWIGSRYVTGSRILGWNRVRRVASRLVNAWGRRRLRLPVADVSSALRVYRGDALQRVDFNRLTVKGYGYLEEILVALHRAGWQIAEIPIDFRPRRAGRSKMRWRDVWGVVKYIGGGPRG